MRGVKGKPQKIWDSIFTQEKKKVSIEKTLHERCRGETSENMGQHLCLGEKESRMQTWDAVDIQNLVFQLSKKKNSKHFHSK